jgi:inner membrane protein
VKWESHKILSFSVVLAATLSFPGAILAAFGSIFPDLIEGKGFLHHPFSVQYQKWQKRHRGLSHLFIMYLSALILSIIILKVVALSTTYYYVALFMAFFFAGCCLHILQDALCGKVPFLTTGKKYGIRLFRVGSIAEHVVVLAISAILLYQVIRNFQRVSILGPFATFIAR